MYAKFPFYHIAQIYAANIESPVAILLGKDNLFWVVEREVADTCVHQGCSLLSNA